MTARPERVAPGVLEIADFFPEGIRAFQTTRESGVSIAPFDGFNLATHVGDRLEHVLENRRYLNALLPTPPVWLNQVHGVSVLNLDEPPKTPTPPTADACWTSTSDRVCAVMTADCLPVLIARPGHHRVAAVHAGWRGLVNGVIEATLDQLLSQAADLGGADGWWVWFGPCIGPDAFEVGPEVRTQFLDRNPESSVGFRAANPDRQTWFADLQQLARQRVMQWAERHLDRYTEKLHIDGDRRCVYRDDESFFSYRRDRDTGRMASLIYCR